MLSRAMTKLSEEETRIDVDLNVEADKKPSDRNQAKVFIRQTKELNFNILAGYLQKQHTWDRNTAAQFLECMSFLDHLLRELPSQRYTMIRKSFFQRGEQRSLLSGNVEAMKGAFASMRIVNNAPRGALLSVNVDVANGTFFCKLDLMDHLRTLLDARDVSDIQRQFNDARNMKNKDGPVAFKHTDFFRKIKILHKLRVETKHRAGGFTIKRFIDKDCTQHSFEKDGKHITVQKYFREVYNISVMPGIPLVEAGNGTYIPADVLRVPENQRYPFKLDPMQTSKVCLRFPTLCVDLVS